MKVKETRGRPKKYDFRLKTGRSIIMEFSDGARCSALRYAKDNGYTYRTWKEDDNLVVFRVA